MHHWVYIAWREISRGWVTIYGVECWMILKSEIAYMHMFRRISGNVLLDLLRNEYITELKGSFKVVFVFGRDNKCSSRGKCSLYRWWLLEVGLNKHGGRSLERCQLVLHLNGSLWYCMEGNDSCRMWDKALIRLLPSCFIGLHYLILTFLF